jgi:hypothetical protein
MASYEEFDRFAITVDVPGQATAATPGEWLVAPAPVRGRVVQVDWIPAAAITANGTNFFSLTVRNRAAGAGTTNVATRSYAATNGVAWTRETQPLVALAVAANLVVAKNDVLTVEKLVTAGGLAMPAGIVTVWIAPN